MNQDDQSRKDHELAPRKSYAVRFLIQFVLMNVVAVLFTTALAYENDDFGFLETLGNVYTNVYLLGIILFFSFFTAIFSGKSSGEGSSDIGGGGQL